MAAIDSVSSLITRANEQYPQREIEIYKNVQGRRLLTENASQPSLYDDLDKRLGLAYNLELSIQGKESWNNSEVRKMKETGKIECLTCKERTYQDGSDDPGVSFKAPGHISPESSAAVVGAHEQEHVNRNQAGARNENKKIISQSVQLFTSICPECGKSYVSGGETRTTTATNKQAAQEESALGNKVDLLT